ncbi:MAG: sulfotransferase [Mariniblastus sp.]|nr:sulfotransferase [Mariniblastus sp.]
MKQHRTSTVFMLAPQRHGSNKTQSLLSANNPHLFGPYPPIPRQAFMKLESKLGDQLLDAMVQNANLSPRPLVPNGTSIANKDVEQELKERNLPADVLGISLALGHLGAKLSGHAKARILCKSPDNLEIAEQFRNRFEDTSYIHLIRDPRAVWNSARGTPRGPQTPHASALKWSDYHTRVLSLSLKNSL